MRNPGRRRRMAPPPPRGPMGGPSALTYDQAQQLLASAATARPLAGGFSPTTVGTGLRSLAAVLGVFLSYAVLRIHELYPVLASIPRFPLLMAIVIALGVLFGTPGAGWLAIWELVPPVRWEVLLVLLGFLTAPFGIWMSGSINFFLFIYSISVVVFIATVVVLRDRDALATTLRVLLLATTVIALYTLSDAASTFGKSDRVALGISLDPNDLAMIMVAMVPLAIWMAQRKGGRSLGWTIAAALAVLAVVPTQSRGAILGLGAVAITLIALGASGWKRTIYIVGIAAAAIAIFALASASGADRLTDFSDYSGGESRTAIWKRGIVWMTWRPWGYGLNNFPIFFGWMNGNERAAHNSFIEVGVEFGVLGLLAYVMLWYQTAKRLLAQRRHALSLRTRVPGAEREASLAALVLASMAGTVVTGFFLSKGYAGITMFVQGLGVAVLLGYPYRQAMTARQPTQTATPAIPPGRHPRAATGFEMPPVAPLGRRGR